MTSLSFFSGINDCSYDELNQLLHEEEKFQEFFADFTETKKLQIKKKMILADRDKQTGY